MTSLLARALARAARKGCSDAGECNSKLGTLQVRTAVPLLAFCTCIAHMEGLPGLAVRWLGPGP